MITPTIAVPLIRDTRCFFLHIPRCGGTSIASHFGYADGALEGVVQDGSRWITLHHLTVAELVGRGYLSRETLATYHVFTTIRDPIERLLSDYGWQRVHDRHGIFTGMTFSAYLDFAAEIVSGERYFEKVHFDHFRPMVDYCFHEGESVVDDILLLEDISREVHRLPMVVKDGRLPFSNSFREHEAVQQAERYRDRVYDIYRADVELYERVRSDRALASGR